MCQIMGSLQKAQQLTTASQTKAVLFTLSFMNFPCILKLLFLISSFALYEVLLQKKGQGEVQENPLKQQSIHLQVAPRSLAARTQLVLRQGLFRSPSTKDRNLCPKMVGFEPTGKRKQHKCAMKGSGQRQFLRLDGFFE